MAVLANGFHTIEAGSILWRHIVNYDFNNMYSKAAFDALATLYSNDPHTHTEYKERAVAESDITTAMGTTFGYDLKYSGELRGFVLKDRTTAIYKRLYVDGGVLLTEDI